MENLPEISLGTAALIIFGICAGYMFLRGIVRTFLTTAFLLASVWVGFRIWQFSPTIAYDLTGGNSPIITTGLPVVAALATFFILRKILGLLRNPVPDDDSDTDSGRSGGFLFRLIATLIPAILICLTAAAIIHHGSAVVELKNSIEGKNESDIASRLNKSISAAVPEWLMDQLDPMTSAPRLELVKRIISDNKASTLEPVIDPETGKPYPRAIIVDDPELQTLVSEGRFSTLLRHPLVSEAVKDPSIRKALGLK